MSIVLGIVVTARACSFAYFARWAFPTVTWVASLHSVLALDALFRKRSEAFAALVAGK